jgi:hypothetical protein
MSRRLRALLCATLLFALLLAPLAVPPAAAQNDWKLRKFNATPDQCYEAARRALTNRYEITFRDAKLRVIRYKIGVTALSWGYRMAMSIAPSMDGAGCVATHDVEVKGGPILSWGRGKKEVTEVYARMEEELAALFGAEKKDTPD